MKISPLKDKNYKQCFKLGEFLNNRCNMTFQDLTGASMKWLSSGLLVLHRPDDSGVKHLWNLFGFLLDYSAKPRRQSFIFNRRDVLSNVTFLLDCISEICRIWGPTMALVSEPIACKTHRCSLLLLPPCYVSRWKLRIKVYERGHMNYTTIV
jgi:hypothetical protein